jgi:hypothetical protein
MKSKGISTVDIDSAIKKIAASGHKIDNYIVTPFTDQTARFMELGGISRPK